MMKLAFRCGLTCLGLGLLACKSEPELIPISSTKAALSASENSDRALQGLVDAGDFLTGSSSLAQTLSAFGGGTSCESSGSACFGDTSSCPPPETVCTSSGVDEADLEESRTELREDLHDLVQRLRERILIPANLESETETSATYRLGPDVLCDEDDAPVLPGGSIQPTLDPDCVEQAERLQLRLRLTSANEGDVDATLLVGRGRNQPVVFELYQHSIGVRVDLGEALDVAREFGEDTQAIERLAGVLELQLVENQARDYSLQLNVLEALDAVVESEGDRVSASLGATSPALELRVDGNARRLIAGMDLGALRVLGPLRVFADSFGSDSSGSSSSPSVSFDAPPGGSGGSSLVAPAPIPEEVDYRGMIELFLAGLQGTLEYTADRDVLNLNGLGFGDATSSIKHDGNTLLALDLNAAQGRHVNLVLEPEGDHTKVSISPGFDLRVALAFHHIADQVEGIADYLLDDTWHFWFEGDAPVIVPGDDQLRVEAGTLHLESTADPSANLSVAAGMCLTEGATPPDGEGDDWRHRVGAGVCE